MATPSKTPQTMANSVVVAISTNPVTKQIEVSPQEFWVGKAEKQEVISVCSRPTRTDPTASGHLLRHFAERQYGAAVAFVASSSCRTLTATHCWMSRRTCSSRRDISFKHQNDAATTRLGQWASSLKVNGAAVLSTTPAVSRALF